MVGRRPTLVLDDPLEPDLESALARGEDAWPEFAAWLTEQGSPRGEAIVRERVLNGIGTADDTWLKTIYGAIHRCSAAAQLARHDSWQFTWLRGFPGKATFMLAATRAMSARAYVEARWQLGREDPEVAASERGQLEHGLGLAELRFLHTLELEVSEFEANLPVVARLLAARRWDHLGTLRLAVAHYDPAAMGADEAQEKALVTGAEGAAMLAVMPRLTRLELVGHFFFPALAHAGLRALRLVGHMPVLDGGFQRSREQRDDRGLFLPRLERLELAAMHPSGAGGPPMDACMLGLDPARLPALRHLELQDAALGDASGRGGVFETLARSPILAQLRTLRLARIDVAGAAAGSIVRELAPRFAHLERLVVDEVRGDEAEVFTAGNLVRAGQ